MEKRTGLKNFLPLPHTPDNVDYFLFRGPCKIKSWRRHWLTKMSKFRNFSSKFCDFYARNCHGAFEICGLCCVCVCVWERERVGWRTGVNSTTAPHLRILLIKQVNNTVLDFFPLVASVLSIVLSFFSEHKATMILSRNKPIPFPPTPVTQNLGWKIIPLTQGLFFRIHY